MKKILLSSTVIISLSAFGASMAYAEGGQRGDQRGEHRIEQRALSFEQIDANSDGVLTMEEFQAPATSKFSDVDTNGDGQLDAEELMAAAERERAQMIERLMERKDTNGDGMLSMEEMASRNSGQFFEKADEDGNGEISQAEWDAAKEKMRGQGRRGHGRRGHGGHGHQGGHSGN